MHPYWKLIVTAALLAVSFQANAQDVPFLETPESVVEAMLELAEVSEDDVVYDLGSGDGRIVIAAAAKYGARGVGIESDSELILLSNEKAEEAGVEGRVKFLLRDFFKADFSRATVVVMYLSPKVNRKLQPLLAEQLAPGTRVVSHKYEIGGWEPVERIKAEGRTIFLYVVP
jgi:SAM-dependent methyltransferase